MNKANTQKKGYQKRELLIKYTSLLMARMKFLWAGLLYRFQHPNGSLQFVLPTTEKSFLELSLSNKKVALFVIWSPKYTALYEHYLRLLKDLDFEVIIIVNGEYDWSKFHDLFKEKSIALLSRKNVGRDFGAYKECIQFFYSHNIEPSHLLICNDSVFANMQPNDSRFINFIIANMDKHFLSASDYMGKPTYHLQSYFLIFSRAVFLSPKFRKFWRRFFVTDDRRLNILAGEVKLSRAIISDGFTPEVFLKSEELITQLTLNDSFITDFINDLSVNEHLRRSTNIQKQTKRLGEILSLSKTSMENCELKELEQEVRLIIGHIIKNYGTVATSPFSIIRQYGFPFLKRDLVSRGIIQYKFLDERCNQYNTELVNAYLDDQRSKKSYFELDQKTRRLLDAGIY